MTNDFIDHVKFTCLELFGSLPIFAATLVILWLGKLLYNKTTSFCFHEELTEKDNSALGTALSGYLIGLYNCGEVDSYSAVGESFSYRLFYACHVHHFGGADKGAQYGCIHYCKAGD